MPLTFIVFLHRYDRVVDVCSLRADLEIFPCGDQTEVGAPNKRFFFYAFFNDEV